MDTTKFKRINIKNSIFNVSASGDFPLYNVIYDWMADANFYKDKLLFNKKNLEQRSLNDYGLN